MNNSEETTISTTTVCTCDESMDICPVHGTANKNLRGVPLPPRAPRQGEAEYENRERRQFHADLERNERAPLADRREARAEFAEALKNPDLIGERVHWLIQGNYGYGSYRAAREVCKNKRMNREAWLCTTIANLEWQCPVRWASAEFMKLTDDQKRRVTEFVNSAILFWEEEEKENAQG